MGLRSGIRATRGLKNRVGPERRLLTVTAVGLSLAILTAPAWAVSMAYLDDSNLTMARIRDGFWGPTVGVFQMFSWYRILSTVGMSFVYASDHLWVIRCLGVLAHVSILLLTGHILRRAGFGGGGAAAFLVVFGLFPYSLEATTWPAAFSGYPVALLVVVSSAAVLAHRLTSRAATAGAAFACTAASLLQEQVVPLVALLLLFHVLAVRRSLVAVLAGAAPAALAFIVAIRLSVETNPRFTGANAASLSNLVSNAAFLKQYSRLTLFGDLFWQTGGFGSAFAVLGAFLGVLLTVLCFLTAGPMSASLRSTDRMPKAQLPGLRAWTARRVVLLGAIAALGLAACIGTVAPLLTSGSPYLTARVMYLPVFGLAIAFSACCEAASVAVGRRVAAFVLLPSLASLGGWSGMALAAEASAYRTQLDDNARVLASLMRTAHPVQTIQGGRSVVVAGLPATVVPRPQFGEHILTIGPANVALAAVRQGADQAAFELHLDFRAGWDGICLLQDGRVSILHAYQAAHPGPLGGVKNPAEEADFALWIGKGWRLQRPDRDTPYAGKLKGIVPDCQQENSPPAEGPVTPGGGPPPASGQPSA
jgi:hypothetical protein